MDELVKDEAESIDTKRNRQERRCVEVFDFDPLKQDLSDERDGLIRQIIRCTRQRNELNTKTKYREESYEQCYYLSTSTYTAKEYLKIIREHWHIENKEHNVRDNSYEEDKSRIRKNPRAMAILKSMSLNILRTVWTKNISVTRKENGFSLKLLFERFWFLLT